MIYNELFEQVLREAEEFEKTNTLKQIWLNIKKTLRNNEKPLEIVEFNEENYKKFLGGGVNKIATGYKNTFVIMQTGENDGFDFYNKLKTIKDIRGLKAGRSILLYGVKETLEKPILVISDHDGNRHPAISYIRS